MLWQEASEVEYITVSESVGKSLLTPEHEVLEGVHISQGKVL